MPRRRPASSSSIRMRSSASSCPMGVRASGRQPCSSSQRRAESGSARRPANMSSSSTTPTTATSGAGSLTSGASTRATTFLSRRGLRRPSIVTVPVSGRMRPLAMRPSTDGRCSVSAVVRVTRPDANVASVAGRMPPARPFETSSSTIFTRGLLRAPRRPPASRGRRRRGSPGRRPTRLRAGRCRAG
ncbi:hypothetical protein E2R54_04885 [Microbacterium oleivorans]|uniref:Uncharacterized protein n=1 Tax=Microbacterium oleivorans TaxID=273677 RepID=A0A4R5YM92_9MICO|nr:hypothetical protein E2R54_04885 [Microbacterium oleivorans]